MKGTIYAALAVLALSVPASAQGQGNGPSGLPPYEILTILRSTGLDPIGQPVRRGPNYVLRAVDDTDREVSVVVSARSGSVLSVTPVRRPQMGPPPRGGVAMSGYERMPPGYIPPGVYDGRTPVIEDDDDVPPRLYNAPRPPAAVPGAPVRSGNAALPPRGSSSPTADDDDDVVSATPSEPRVITAIEPNRDGLLPPPPERFPQRVAPQAPPKPKAAQQPVQRAAAAPPKAAPLPKPKPSPAPAAEYVPPPLPADSPYAPAAPSAPAKAAPVEETPH